MTATMVAMVVLTASAAAQMAGTMASDQKAGMMKSDGMMMKNEFLPFTKEAYAEAKAAGKTTLVFFHAPWCPICRGLEPKVLKHLNGDAKNVVAFKVDYDSNEMLRKDMMVEKQSTLILAQGMKEIARISYVSDDASLDAFFAKAMMK
jgi:thiol-disulfide isomerase/thioredoxin